MGKSAPLRPTWTENIGELADNEILVKASCDKCGEWKVVDLAALIAAKGRDFDLWNRRSICRLTDGCDGPVRFMFNGGTMMRGMWD